MFKKTFNMFIAQPMHCCDDDLIRGQRAAITKIVTAYVKDVHFKDAMFEMDVNAIDQFDVADPDDFEKTHHSERSKRMYRLGRSIQYLGGADFAVFYGDWMHARGCVVEYIACCQYRIPILSEKTLIDFCKGRYEFDDEFKLLWPDEFNEFHHTSGITDDIINEMTEMIIKSFNFDVPDINKRVWRRDTVEKGINEFLNNEENQRKFKRKIYDAMNLKPEDDVKDLMTLDDIEKPIIL